MPARVFCGNWFDRYCAEEGIEEGDLLATVAEMERGILHARLGSGLHKQRLATEGAGKSGGHRLLLAFRAEHRAVFVFGFSKNERDNLSPQEEKAFRKQAKHILALSEDEMQVAVDAGVFREVRGDR